MEASDLFERRPASPSISEFKSRRIGWTRGASVYLADGMFWRLPRIELCLLLTSSEVHVAIIDAINMADRIASEADTNDVETMLFQAQLAHVAIRLLHINYDLPEVEWKNLFKLGDVVKITELASVIGIELHKSANIWMPFFLTAGSEGRDNLMLN